MISYYGDFAEDDTVLIPFNTFSSDDPSASVTITNLADADLKVHKDGGTTQIATDGATIAIDFDGITGNHLATIDTSVHADYATGSEYAVRMEGTTIDGATINAWIGAFSIERAGGVLALLKGTNSLANIEDKIDIIDTNVDDIETVVVTNATGADIAADIITVDTAVDAIKVATDKMVFTTANKVDSRVDNVAGTAQTAGDLAALITTLDTVADAIKVVTDKFAFTVANLVDANLLAISGDTAAADNLEESATAIVLDTAKAGTLSTTQMSTNLSESTNDHFIGRTVIWTTGVLANQASDITDYVGTNGVLTFSVVTEAPSAGDAFVIV